MPIRTIQIDDRGSIAREVEIDSDEAVQCCRVQDADQDANQLWFFEPTQEFMQNELAGKIIDRSIMISDPVILRFNTSAPIVALIQDLMVVYGNLVKQGL